MDGARNVTFSHSVAGSPQHGPVAGGGHGGSNPAQQLQPIHSLSGHRPSNVAADNGPGAAVKASILWRDFMNGIRKRKRHLKLLKQAALENTETTILKNHMMELRQSTLRVIEDSLEIEYRVRLASEVLPQGWDRQQLPMLTSYNHIEKREDLQALAEMISDSDELFQYPAVRVMFPNDFPLTRNPFLFGKNVDELCEIIAPTPESGNISEELKVLELMRFKRAAKALLRAEIQIKNSLPINLVDVEELVVKRNSEPHLDLIFRTACTLLYNDPSITGGDAGPGLRIMNDSRIIIEAQDLLMKLNQFKGSSVSNVTLKSAVRHALRDLPLLRIRGNAAIFLLEWMAALIGTFGISSEGGGSSSSSALAGIAPGSRQSSRQGSRPGSRQSSLQPVGQIVAPYDFWEERRAAALAANPPSRSPSREYIQFGGQGDIGSTRNRGELAGISSHDASGGGGMFLPKEVVKRMTIGGMGMRGPDSRDGARPSTADFAGGLADISLSDDMPSRGGSADQNSRSTRRQKLAAALATDNMDIDGVLASVSGKEISGQALVPAQKPRDSHHNKLSGMSDEKLWTRVRGEVDRMLKKHGIGRRHEKRELGHEADADAKEKQRERYEVAEPETLSAVRYELVKMQQELIRRKVLDPHHYAALSVDTLIPLREKETQNQNINVRFSDRGFMEGKAAAGPAKLAKLMGNARAAEPTIGKILKLGETQCTFVNGDKAIVEMVLDLDTETVIGKVHRIVDGDADNPFKNQEPKKKKPKEARQTIAFARANKLLVNRLTGNTPHGIRTVTNVDERLAIVQNIMDQLVVRTMQDPPPRGRLILIADRVIVEKNIVSSGIAANMVIERDEDDSGIIITVTPISSLNDGRATSSSSSGAGRTVTLAGVERDPTYGSTSLRVSDKELRVLLLNQRGLYDLAMGRWSSMITVANWLSSRIVLQRSDMVVPTKSTNTPGILKYKGLGSTSPPKKVTLTQPGLLENTMKEAGGGAGAVGGEKYTPASNNITEVVELILNRKVELPSEAKKQWKSRNLPVIKGMEVKIVAFQELEMLVFQVTLSIPQPDVEVLAVAAAGGEGKLIDFASFDELQWKEEEEEIRKMKTTSVKERPKMPPIQLTMKYQLTDSELLVFGTTEKVDNKTVKLGGDSTVEHPATFVWNIISRLHVTFKGAIKNPFNPLCSALDLDNWILSYDRLLLRTVKNISGGIVVVSAAATDIELVFEAEPTSQEIFKEIGGKRLSEREIIDTVMTEAWPASILQLPNRYKLSRALLEQLKIIEDKGSHRIELSSFPETRLMQIIIPADRDKGYENDIVLGTCEINNFMTLYDLRVVIKFELDKKVVPRTYRFMYKGAACAPRQEPLRKAWECLPRCSLAVPRVDVSVPGDDGGGALAIAAEVARKSNAQKAAEKRAEILKAVNEGRRRFNMELVPVPIMTLGRVQDGSPDLFVLHDLPEEILKPGDIIRIGNVESRDYIIGLRTEEQTQNCPKHFTIRPNFSMANEDDYTAPTMENFPYNAYALDSGYCNTPASIGYTFDLRKFESEREKLFKPVEEAEMEHSDIKAAFITKYDTLSESEKLKATVKQLAASKAPPVGDTEVTQAGKEKKEGEEGDNEEEDDHLGQEEEKKDEGPLVYQEVWLWKCIPKTEDKRTKFRTMYDNGEITYKYKFAHPKHRNKELWYFRIPVSVPKLEIMCTDLRCPNIVNIPYGQRVAEMQRFPTDELVRIVYEGMLQWYPQNPTGIVGPKFTRCMKEMRCFPDINKAPRINQLDAMFLAQMYIVRQKVPNAKTLDFENFCILLQKIALMRFPHVDKFIEEWAQTPGGRAVVLAAAKAKRAAALAMTAEEMNMGLKNPLSALGKPAMLMSEADMGGGNNSAVDTATVSTIEGGSVSVGNDTVEGGDESGEVLVKRGGTAGDKKGQKGGRNTPSGVDKGRSMSPAGTKGEKGEKGENPKNRKGVNPPGRGRDKGGNNASPGGRNVTSPSGRGPARSVSPSTVTTIVAVESSTSDRTAASPSGRVGTARSSQGRSPSPTAIPGKKDRQPTPTSLEAKGSEGEKKGGTSPDRRGRGGPKFKKKKKTDESSVGSLAAQDNDARALLGQEPVEEEEEKEEEEVIDPNFMVWAYHKLITDFLVSMDSFIAIFWEEAKLRTIMLEGKKFCAATRIAARFRHYAWRKRYLTYKTQLTKVQNGFRRKVALRYVRKLRRSLYEDWIFRRRYFYVTRINSVVRMFLKKCWLRNVKRDKILTAVAEIEARRFKLRKLRQREKRALLYIECKKICGYSTVLKVVRRDTRFYSRDYSIVVCVYMVKSQHTHKFEMDESELRSYVRKFLDLDEVTVGDLIDKGNLRRVIAERLIVRPPKRENKPPFVLFAKKNAPQQGTKVTMRGREISGQTFVATIYEAGAEIVATTYHPLSCSNFSTRLLIPALHQWYKDEYFQGGKAELEKQAPLPMLQLDKKVSLYKWAADRLVVDSRHGQYKVLFECQYQRSRKIEAITRIQATFRMFRCRNIYYGNLSTYLLRVYSTYDPETNVYAYYYVNLKNGECTWTKPTVVGRSELPYPENRWYTMNYYQDDTWLVQYINPYTGKYSHLSVDRAVRMIQGAIRNSLLRVVLPARELVVKVIRLTKKAEASYNKETRDLAPVINWAITKQALHMDEAGCKDVYKHAIELSAFSPLVRRAYAIFQISMCKAPIAAVRDRALKQLDNASYMDATVAKFQTALAFYEYACVLRPRCHRAHLNLALVDILIFNNVRRGERVLRRAIAYAPFDHRVMENWSYLKERFPEQQMLYYPSSRVEMTHTGKAEDKGGKKRSMYGYIVTENIHWAGWVYVDENDNPDINPVKKAAKMSKKKREKLEKEMKEKMKDDKFKDWAAVTEALKINYSFWYNPADGTQQPDPPDFQWEFLVRKRRSAYIEQKGGLELYYDPLTNVHFQYHPLTDSYS